MDPRCFKAKLQLSYAYPSSLSIDLMDGSQRQGRPDGSVWQTIQGPAPGKNVWICVKLWKKWRHCSFLFQLLNCETFRYIARFERGSPTKQPHLWTKTAYRFACAERLSINSCKRCLWVRRVSSLWVYHKRPWCEKEHYRLPRLQSSGHRSQ